MAEIIQLKKKNTLVFDIQDEEGNLTGEKLEFDMEDIELPLRYQECIERHKRNIQSAEFLITAIDKKQDHSGKKMMSSNQEEKQKVINEFYKREMETLDMVLGKDGCKKLLNGRKPYYSMFSDISEIMENILPIIKANVVDTKEKIKEKYKEKETDVLE